MDYKPTNGLFNSTLSDELKIFQLISAPIGISFLKLEFRNLKIEKN
jgi:hypothetical protein